MTVFTDGFPDTIVAVDTVALTISTNASLVESTAAVDHPSPTYPLSITEVLVQ